MDYSRAYEIIKEYNTPLYILDLASYENDFKELRCAYESVYKPFQIAYSFKTNYIPAIIKSVHALGGLAEVVSVMEYELARRVGFPANDIIVNGPGKWFKLQDMASDGSIIMLDNNAELDRIIKISKEVNHPIKIGFRLNFQIGSGKDSRFGFEADSITTQEAIKKARATDNILIVGLHFHLSGARNKEAWKIRAEKMVHYANSYLESQERKIIDLGSGMFGKMSPEFQIQFGNNIPSFADYAETVAAVFQNTYGDMPESQRPKLVVEPGTTLVANSMVYATQVISMKSIRGKVIAFVDGSVQQIGEVGKKRRLPYRLVYNDSTNSRKENVIVTGYTCLEDDLLIDGTKASIGVGDIIVFENAGAYTNVLKPPFILPGCKIVAFDENKVAFVVKREECFDDIFSSYMI